MDTAGAMVKMSRSYNTHSKDWNFPLRYAKKWSNKNRRAHGKRLLVELRKSEDTEDVETPIDVLKDSGAGDIWNYD